MSMPCMICGAPGFSSGDGHLCPEHGGRPPALVARPRPSTLLQGLTWLFVAVTVTYAGLLLANIGALAVADGIIDRVVADPASLTTPGTQQVLRLADMLGTATVLWIWLYIAGFLAWSITSRRSVRSLGYDRKEILSHWTYIAWRLSLVLVIVMSLVLANRTLPNTGDLGAYRDAFISHSHALMGYTALRIGMLGLLSAYVIIVWRRLTGAA